MKTLRSARIANGLTMKQLGELVGLSESAISRYERSEREPDYATIQKLAEVLHTSVEYLLTGRESVALSDLAGMSPEAIAHFIDSLPGFPRLGTDPNFHAEMFPLSDAENSLIATFRTLNPAGQKVLMDVAKSLVAGGLYQRA